MNPESVMTSEADPLDLRREQTWVVAELSANHGGSRSRALDTIAAAAEAGADAIKIQTYTPDSLTLDCDAEPFQIRGGLWDGRRLYDLYGEAQTPWEWHPELFEAAARAGIPIFSTPFDERAVDLLEELGAPAHKIASFELIHTELVSRVASTGKPILLSTGMANRDEIEAAVRTIRRVWGEHDPGLALLHCVSAYPAQPADMNLATLPDLARSFDAIPGVSDHSLCSAVAVASVALGARVIEKHFTLSRADGGPDSAFSIEPHELRGLVDDVRVAEQAIGRIRYGPEQAEDGSLLHRRSIFVVQDVKAGETLTRECLRVIRPGAGLHPRHWPGVLGRRASRDLPRGTPLLEEMMEPEPG